MRQQTLDSPRCEIRSFTSPDELAGAAAEDWLELMQVLEMAGRDATVALSGGRIARQFFDRATALFAGHPSLLRHAHFFWADERCVRPDHPESNYWLALKHLLKPLEVPEVNIHRIPGEFDTHLATTTVGRALAKWTGADAEEMPALDLVFLGMGEDGHVASLFPGEAAEVMDSPDYYRAVTAPKPPPQRVTMGYGVLAQAENAWVLASGEGKAGALKQSLASANGTPLGRVLALRSGTRIYTDLSPAGGFEG